MSDQEPWSNELGIATSPQIDAPFTSIDASRATILDAIGESPDVTFVRTSGNIGDQLIWSGTRNLLRGHIYREIDFRDISTAGGDVAVIAGGGAWCRRYCAYMPELLAIAELRFSKVIVLPSTFEVAADRVRRALDRSNATFFAREHQSFSQIRGLCDARVAHDCALFVDYTPFLTEGLGELNAFRTDDESTGLIDLPDDNDDISETAGTLNHWIHRIAEHQTVNTDRAHVMIAAAMMGKRVRYTASGYFKVPAIAATLPRELHVEPLTTADLPDELPATSNWELQPARTTIAVIGNDDPEGVAASLAAIREADTNTATWVFDRNSSARNRRELAGIVDGEADLTLTLADRTNNFADVAQEVTERTSSEYVMFLRPGMQLQGDALARLIEHLDDNPDAIAAAPALVSAEGTIESCGGWMSVGSDSLALRRTARDRPASSLDVESAETGWLPLQGSLIRRSALNLVPVEGYGDHYVQSIDWCRRVTRLAPNSLHACPAARLRIEWPSEAPTDRDFRARIQAVHALTDHAAYFDRHRLLLIDRLGMLVPELRDGFGEVDETKARLLLAFVTARGPEWTLMEWMNGGLEPLLGLPADHDLQTLREHAAAERSREHVRWLEQRNERLIGIESGRWWRLRERLQPVRRLLGRHDAGGAK